MERTQSMPTTEGLRQRKRKNKMPAKYTASYRDHSKEISAFSCYLVSGYDVLDIGAIQSAVDALTLGSLQKTTESNITAYGISPAGSNAFRERALDVLCEDNVTHKPVHISIPIADFSKVTFIPNTDFVVIAAGSATAEVTALINAIETKNVGSEAGNTLSVISIEAVGRNN